MESDELLAGLDPEQARVVRTLGEPVAVIAGAGTGKTRTIVHRLAYAIDAGAIDPRATLAVTFTTAAAAEVSRRLDAMGTPKVASRTFHSACLRQAQYFWPQIYNATLPAVTDRRDLLIKQACARLGLPGSDAVVREIDAEIAWTKQTNVLPEQYEDLARADRRSLAYVDIGRIPDAIVAYEDAKQAACVIDLDDVLLCTLALLATSGEVARKVRNTYRHFVFDEFQDVSPVQVRLAELWVGGRGDVCVVGDPAQTIHSYAGSRSAYLTSFAAKNRAAELDLTLNHRSTPQIVAAANLVNASSRKLRPSLAPGAPVEVRSYPDPQAESVGVAQWLKALHRDGLAWEDMAVLFRTRAGAESVRQILADQAVPFNYRHRDQPDRPGVTLTTLHSSKGLEWEAVAICGVHDQAFPHPAALSDEQIAESRRVLYVGMTRARSFLSVSWPATVDSRPRSPSPFLGGLV